MTLRIGIDVGEMHHRGSLHFRRWSLEHLLLEHTHLLDQAFVIHGHVLALSPELVEFQLGSINFLVDRNDGQPLLLLDLHQSGQLLRERPGIETEPLRLGNPLFQRGRKSSVLQDNRIFAHRLQGLELLLVELRRASTR